MRLGEPGTRLGSRDHDVVTAEIWGAQAAGLSRLVARQTLFCAIKMFSIVSGLHLWIVLL
jgi:hypothetical protein